MRPERLLQALEKDPLVARDGLEQRALVHGLGPLLYSGSRQERWQRSYHLNAVRNQLLLEELADVLGRLEPVMPVVLKGAHLAYHVYAQPALRFMGDLDLLVSPDEVPEVRRRLEAAGYQAEEAAWNLRRHYHLTMTHPERQAPVEVHWGLHRPELPFRVSLDKLTREAPVKAFGGARGRVLEPDRLLLYLAFHLVKHRFRSPLRGLCDLVVCLEHQEPDWERLQGWADEWGFGHTLGVVFGALRLFSVETPLAARDDDVDEALRRVLSFPEPDPPGLPAHPVRGLLLGRDPTRGGWLDPRKIVRRARRGVTMIVSGSSPRAARFDDWLWKATPRLSRGLALEAWFLLLAAELALRTVGYVRLACWLRLEAPPSEGGGPVEELVTAVASVARDHPARPLCLARSVTLCLMLRRRGLGGKVVLGARRQEGRFQAHAWVEHRGVSLEEQPAFKPFR